jgi:Domain of unknown function (DUF4034)
VCLSVVALAALASAGCVAQTTGQDHETSAGTSGCGGPAPDQQEPFKADVRAMLERKQFEALDGLAAELNRTNARFAGGDWKSYRFQEALGTPAGGCNDTDPHWEELLAVLARWREQRPASIPAAIASADASVGYGWKARGTGYANTVTPDRWRLLGERMAPAEGILMSGAGGAARTLEWYRAMIDLGRVQGWDSPRVEALFEQAVALEPRYLHVYSAMARYLTPRWQGGDGDWEDFAERSAERLGGREGSVVYSHIAWQISKLHRGHEFFEQNRVSWQRIKQGFIDREALYGASLRNLNAFCMLAGAAADRQTTRELLARIGDEWDPGVWRERKYFDGYRKWASE